MTSTRKRALRIALVAVGLICIFGVYPLTVVSPSGWRRDPDNGLYLQMILSIYATLGVFLLLAARAPEQPVIRRRTSTTSRNWRRSSKTVSATTPRS